MADLFSKNPEYLIPIFFIVCGALVAIVAIVATQWRAVRQIDIEAALKQDMLNRGLPVEEIERIVRASSTVPAGTQGGEPVSDNEYYLVEKLVDEGKSADEIERILRVFRTKEEGAAVKNRNGTSITSALEAQRV
jgi:hypothetical protein